jgi:hypothetical protein
LKNLIKFGLVVYMLYQFYRTWLELAAEQSMDAASGFVRGLIYMAFLFFLIKNVDFAYEEVSEWRSKTKEEKQ